MTSRPIVWRYIYGCKRKHAFYQAPRVGSFETARCGIGPHWSDPEGWLGARAEQVDRLKGLQQCARCVDNLKRDRGPA